MKKYNPKQIVKEIITKTENSSNLNSLIHYYNKYHNESGFLKFFFKNIKLSEIILKDNKIKNYSGPKKTFHKWLKNILTDYFSQTTVDENFLKIAIDYPDIFYVSYAKEGVKLPIHKETIETILNKESQLYKRCNFAHDFYTTALEQLKHGHSILRQMSLLELIFDFANFWLYSTESPTPRFENNDEIIDNIFQDKKRMDNKRYILNKNNMINLINTCNRANLESKLPNLNELVWSYAVMNEYTNFVCYIESDQYSMVVEDKLVKFQQKHNSALNTKKSHEKKCNLHSFFNKQNPDSDYDKSYLVEYPIIADNKILMRAFYYLNGLIDICISEDRENYKASDNTTYSGCVTCIPIKSFWEELTKEIESPEVFSEFKKIFNYLVTDINSQNFDLTSHVIIKYDDFYFINIEHLKSKDIQNLVLKNVFQNISVNIKNIKSMSNIFEKQTENLFIENGWKTIRNHGLSTNQHSDIDILAFKDNKLVIVECKLTYERVYVDKQLIHNNSVFNKAKKQLLKRINNLDNYLTSDAKANLNITDDNFQIIPIIVTNTFPPDSKYDENIKLLNFYELSAMLKSNNFQINEFDFQPQEIELKPRETTYGNYTIQTVCWF